MTRREDPDKIELTDRQRIALSMLISSAAPSSRGTGVRLGTIKALVRRDIVRPYGKSDPVNVDTYVSVTPLGFRVWANLIECRDRMRDQS